MHFMLSLLGPTSNRAYPGRSKSRLACEKIHMRMTFSTTFRWKNWLFNRGPFCTLEVKHGTWKSYPWKRRFLLETIISGFMNFGGGVMVYTNHQRTGLQLKLGSVFYWWFVLWNVRWWITIKPPFGRICFWLVSGILCKSRDSSYFSFTNL